MYHYFFCVGMVTALMSLPHLQLIQHSPGCEPWAQKGGGSQIPSESNLHWMRRSYLKLTSVEWHGARIVGGGLRGMSSPRHAVWVSGLCISGGKKLETTNLIRWKDYFASSFRNFSLGILAVPLLSLETYRIMQRADGRGCFSPLSGQKQRRGRVWDSNIPFKSTPPWVLLPPIRLHFFLWLWLYSLKQFFFKKIRYILIIFFSSHKLFQIFFQSLPTQNLRSFWP